MSARIVIACVWITFAGAVAMSYLEQGAFLLAVAATALQAAALLHLGRTATAGPVASGNRELERDSYAGR